MRVPQIVFSDRGQIYVLVSAPSTSGRRSSATSVQVACARDYRSRQRSMGDFALRHRGLLRGAVRDVVLLGFDQPQQ